MDFLAPHRLWLLAVVAMFSLLYIALNLMHRRYAVRFSNVDLLASVAPQRPGWRRHLTAIAFLAGTSMLVVAYAQPIEDQQVPAERATVIVALDTSLSMEATDVGDSRLDAAMASASAFVELIPDSINVALVSFHGVATVQVPPTTDHARVIESINALELNEATAIGDAIIASLAAIDSVPADEEGTPPPARIVLMSDGETTQGTPNEVAVQLAIDAGVPVSTIAFGTADGVISDPLGGGLIPVPVKLDPLEEIAVDTGGSFFAAASGDQLNAVYADIGSSVGFETAEVDVTSRFVGFGLGLLALSSGLSLAFFSRLP